MPAIRPAIPAPITTHESYAAAASESAHVMTLDTTLSNGVKTRVRGIFTYRTNEAGKIVSLRGYWHMGVMEFEQPTRAAGERLLISA